MEASKEQLKNAILFFAKTFDEEKSYKALMKDDIGLPKIVEMIVYDMFLNRFNAYFCPDEQYTHYKVILEYATELRQNGWVVYKQNKEG